MMKQMTLAVVAILVATFFSACTPSDKNYKALVANEWTLERIIYADSNYSEEAPKVLHIAFADSSKRVFGNAGCNNFNGGFTTTDQSGIEFGPLASTMMWCPEMGFEDRYSKLLAQVKTYTANDHELILTDSEGKFTIHYVAKVTPLKSATDQIVNEVEGAIEQGVDQLEGTLEDGVDAVKDGAGKVVDGTEKVVKDATKAVVDGAEKVADGAEKTAKKVEKKLDL